MNKENITLSEKYSLTVREAAQYFGIGENKLRTPLDNNRGESFVLENGNRKLIKRRLFEEYLNQILRI